MPIVFPRLVRFGTFEVDTRAGEIRKDGAKIKLQEKPFRLLLLLLAHPGEIVTREEVREALWAADTFVDFDHSLGTAVAKLRSSLGDTAKNPRFVETVAGRGYRFIAPVMHIAEAVQVQVGEHAPSTMAEAAPPVRDVELVTSRRGVRWLLASVGAGLLIGAVGLTLVLGFDVGGARAWLRRQSNQPIRSLAVLPLENLSRDPSQDYFVDGMTEQLITTLAQFPGIPVISRTSAMQYKGTHKRVPEIGRELNADALIEGSVFRSGERVRISAQLVDARTDQHLWAQSYERDIGDALALQNDIARSIANELRVQLTPRQQTQLTRARPTIPAAQEAYLRGRYHLNNGDESEIRKSIGDFQSAIAIDPEDARSYSGLAQAYVALTDFFERPTSTMPQARAAAQTALQLDETLSDAHMSLGAVSFLHDWDWRRAEAEFKRPSR